MKQFRTLIVCDSPHHGNTRKVADALAEEFPEITVMTINEARAASLKEYDLVGLASGIYYGSFSKPLLAYAETLPRGTAVFTLYTYGIKRDGYVNRLHEILRTRGCRIIGSYGCPGYDTFGPLKLVGGISKDHPNATDIRLAASFYEHLKK
ncbi:MAG: hypothetical protein IKF51_02130 [Solobacterium sp.]|nr:hypothetical protein [Solobacterium sp.]